LRREVEGGLRLVTPQLVFLATTSVAAHV
jgi:hypothetical protein